MRVNPLKSISAKLFYLTIGLVLMAVAALSWKNGESFRQQLSLQYQRTSLDTGENIGQAIEAMFKNWQSQMGLLVQTVAYQEGKGYELPIRNFLLGDDDFVAVHLFKVNDQGVLEAKAFVPSEKVSTNFEAQVPEQVFAKLDKLVTTQVAADIKAYPSDQVHVRSLIREINLPMMSFARSFKLKDSQTTYWVVLSAWQDSVLMNLKSKEAMKTIVLDRDSRVFASKDRNDMKANEVYSYLEIVKMAQTSVVRDGYLGGYRDKSGQEWLGAYYRINKFNLVVLVQQDAESAYAAIRSLIKQTLNWGLFFLLIAVFFSYFGSTGMTKNLRELTIATQNIANGNFKAYLKPKSKDEVGLLSLSVNAMAYHIQQLLLSQVQKARFEKELETANAVQHTLFPKQNRQRLVLNVSGFSKPASECGGDWWGHFVTDDGVEYVFVADAMGHGVPAALVTAMAYSSCMTMVALLKEGKLADHSPKAFLELFNKVLYDAVEGKISMTFFALVIDYRKNRLIYSNAGHNQPILIPSDPDDPRIDRKSPKWQKISRLTPLALKETGTVLGIERDATFTESEMELKNGDRILLFTDGLIECQSPEGKSWGRKVLIEKLLEVATQNASGIKKELVESAFKFFANKPLADDVTLVVVEYPQDAKTDFRLPEEEPFDLKLEFEEGDDEASIKIDLGA
ncbi:MAG: PP2C family protein-serine/threonine phosphatase [Oligoflexales bacterium]